MENNLAILPDTESEDLRQIFIDTFVNTDSEFYKRISKKELCSDGWCYRGLLWGCFVAPKRISEKSCEAFLQDKTNLYVFWDIHSADHIGVPNYWKYPKSSVLLFSAWDREKYIESLPEDIYFFDESLTWCIAYTMEEERRRGRRLCLFSLPIQGRESVGKDVKAFYNDL